MKIAILGIRGIPANYGGFETFAEELSTRLVERGHEVTVYGRSNNVRYPSPTYRGVRLVVLPTIPTKHLDTLAHTFVSVFHALGAGYEAVLVCNAANAALAGVPRLAGMPVALNVDGVERKRQKWGLAGRAHYRLSEYLATLVPNVIVTDAEVMRDYYLSSYGAASVMIAYGADFRRIETTRRLESLGLASRDYLLYVSRLEPENNAHVVIEAYRDVDTTMPLVIVGDAPYARDYIAGLRRMADPRVRFTGAIYGDGCCELRSHAYAYVQATEVGGTHPALLEAMGAGNCVLARETPEHREVLAETGLYYRTAAELAARIRQVLDDRELVARLRARTRERARQRYTWDGVADRYEALFEALARQSPRRGR